MNELSPMVTWEEIPYRHFRVERRLGTQLARLLRTDQVEWSLTGD